ncbi:alpha/beta fold hydrolase [Streptomyces griseus]|uniref:alpha/beta fold hydrolase n=1 Tax=Streptomyces griseus TaxID=1911 RepID=UPI0004C87BAF|nr:alpha/beta fold hydrolase [Streptomyces griseus]
MDEVKTVVSRDGTPIAYARYGAGTGDGPAVVLVSGVPGTGAGELPLARLLARSCPVFVYDRRGHGGSGDAGPYAVEREFEDLAAVLAAAGPGAAVHGSGTAGALALAAAAAGVPVGAVSVFEPPYDVALGAFPEVHARVLVVDGGASPAPVRRAARELSALLPRARHRTLTGQTHEVAPHVLAPVLAEFVAEVAESAGLS